MEYGAWYDGNHVICRLMKIYDMKAAKINADYTEAAQQATKSKAPHSLKRNGMGNPPPPIPTPTARPMMDGQTAEPYPTIHNILATVLPSVIYVNLLRKLSRNEEICLGFISQDVGSLGARSSSARARTANWPCKMSLQGHQTGPGHFHLHCSKIYE